MEGKGRVSQLRVGKGERSREAKRFIGWPTTWKVPAYMGQRKQADWGGGALEHLARFQGAGK